MKPCVFLFLVILSHFLYGQENATASFIRNYKIEEARNSTIKYSEITRDIISWQLDFIQKYPINEDKIHEIEKSQIPVEHLGQFYRNINLGDYNLFVFADRTLNAIKHYKDALQLGLKLNDSLYTCIALDRILFVYRQIYFYQNETYQEYLDMYNEYKYNSLEDSYYNFYKLTFGFKDYDIEYWDYKVGKNLDSLLSLNQELHLLKGDASFVKAIFYEEKNQLDSTWSYINKSMGNYQKFPHKIKISRLDQIFSYKARIALKRKDLQSAKLALQNISSETINLIDYKTIGQKLYYEAVLDTLNGNYKSAFSKYFQYEIMMDKFTELSYNNLFNDLEFKYQTTKKEKQLLISEKENKQKENIVLGLAGGIFGVSLIGFLLFKNTKRKQRIAEQQSEIEIQKTEKLLKEQEITSINAMIDGQEKERNRLASDLHDSVGATLAAAKLQFEHLSKITQPQEQTQLLFSKTGQLLEDAYKEVRSMAHVKNSGVIAKNGLLPAVKKLSRNVSTNDGLVVEVQDFGLENRLEGSLEITIFRIIQELITNIVKHAKATEAGINITQHDDTLSIIIEDNGKGFYFSKYIDKDGMGLSSIDRRVEHLEGTLEIDSSPGKGTTILIDIPL